MYTQVIAPDLNTVGNVGWCLAFVEKAFNATTYSYATATDGWNACQFIHEDRNLPDACVPIWFKYYEGGVNYGHVAIWVPGRGILSSPWKADNTQQWEPDIDTISRVYNSTYLGWSEDLMGLRVIKEGGDMPLTPGQVDHVLKMGLRREPTAAELNNPDYAANAALLIDTVWNNGGSANYEQDKHPNDAQAKLNQIKQIVG